MPVPQMTASDAVPLASAATRYGMGTVVSLWRRSRLTAAPTEEAHATVARGVR